MISQLFSSSGFKPLHSAHLSIVSKLLGSAGAIAGDHARTQQIPFLCPPFYTLLTQSCHLRKCTTTVASIAAHSLPQTPFQHGEMRPPHAEQAPALCRGPTQSTLAGQLPGCTPRKNATCWCAAGLPKFGWHTLLKRCTPLHLSQSAAAELSAPQRLNAPQCRLRRCGRRRPCRR